MNRQTCYALPILFGLSTELAKIGEETGRYQFSWTAV